MPAQGSSIQNSPIQFQFGIVTGDWHYLIRVMMIVVINVVFFFQGNLTHSQQGVNVSLDNPKRIVMLERKKRKVKDMTVNINEPLNSHELLFA